MVNNNRHRNPAERIEIHESKHLDIPDLIVIKGTPRLLMGKYAHDIEGCAESYIALQPHVDAWQVGQAMNDLIPDRVFWFKGVKFYLEMDMGNMAPELLFAKVDRYAQYAGSRERVLFLLKEGKFKVDYIGNQLMGYLQKRKLGNFCTATAFNNFVNHPLIDVIYSPKDGRVTLEQLTQ